VKEFSNKTPNTVKAACIKLV